MPGVGKEEPPLAGRDEGAGQVQGTHWRIARANMELLPSTP